MYRSIGTRSRPVPDAEVVPLADAARRTSRPRIPSSTPGDRREQLARRRAARARALRLTDGVVPEAAPAVGRPSSTRSGGSSGRPPRSSPLDEASLLDAARDRDRPRRLRRRRLARSRSRIFLRALEEEADLHLLGRIMARNEIVRALVNRLAGARRRSRRHPEILDERIDVAGARRRHRPVGHVDPARAARPGSRAPRRAHVGAPAPVPAAGTRDVRDRPAHRGRRPGVHVLAPRRARVPDDARERRRRPQRGSADRHAAVRVRPLHGLVPGAELRRAGWRGPTSRPCSARTGDSCSCSSGAARASGGC